MDLDETELRALAARAKAALRGRMRAVRTALPAAAAARRSQAICRRLVELPAFVEAKGIALFWPMVERGEVDLRAVDRAARVAGKRVYYPFMDRGEETGRLGFRRVEDPGSLVEQGRGFAEPPAEAPEAGREEVDFIVVPALAVSPAGHRLGYGAGFYDTVLPTFRPPAAAAVVAFDFQLLAELPAEPWDIPCDTVVTDARHLEVRSGTEASAG